MPMLWYGLSVCAMRWNVPVKRVLRPSSAHLLPRGGECDRSSSESLLNLQHNRHTEKYVRNRLERHCRWKLMSASS